MKIKRIIAAIIDLLISILILISLLSIFVYNKETLLKVENGQIPISTIQIKVFLIIYISFFYLLIRDFIFGKSIGKMAMKLKIVENTTLKNASIKQLFLRNFILYICSSSFIYFIVDFLLIIFNKGKNLGNIIAKTQIIEDR